MERIEDFAALSPLLTAQLKPGVYTNHLMAPGDYDREIAAGLTVFPFPGGLWLRRSRAGHGLYTFYWQRGAELCPPPAAEAAVTEIVWRPGKEARALEAVARLEAAGWRVLFRRSRWERPACPAEGAGAYGCPDPSQADAVLAFLREQFDPLTGCLPNRADLEVQLAAGEAVAAWDQAGLCGLLHFQTGRTSSEIRHLAVRADQRRNGLASGLLNAYLIKTGGAKSLVWARQGNGPAEGFYQSRGYRPDGWQSAVLAGGKDETT